MFAGILGNSNLLSNLNQAIFVNNRNKAAVASVNICNRNAFTGTFRIAISSSATAPTDAEWLVWDAEIEAKGTVEKQGILIPPTKFLVVRSSIDNMTAMAYGATIGDVVTALGFTNNLGTAPTWVTSGSQLYYSGQIVNQQLLASDEQSDEITYSLTDGDLPTGLSLSTAGVISGTVPTAGYPSADEELSAEITATDQRGNQTPQTFSIIRRWGDGTSALSAGPSASVIKTLTGTTTNGSYWIDIDGTPVETYCLMSVGVGYMLAAKIAAASVSDWSFDGANWTRSTTLNESSIANATAGDAVGRTYYDWSTRTGFAMALGSVTNVLTFNRSGVTPRAAFTEGGPFRLNNQLTRANFMSWIATAGTAGSNWDNQPNGNWISMNSLEIANAGLRFGITMNNEADNLSNDSAIGFGTFTNGDRTGLRSIPAGGHRWSPDQKFQYQGYIFVA